MANKQLGITYVRKKSWSPLQPITLPTEDYSLPSFANELPDLVLETTSARASSQFPQEIIPWVYVSTKWILKNFCLDFSLLIPDSLYSHLCWKFLLYFNFISCICAFLSWHSSNIVDLLQGINHLLLTAHSRCPQQRSTELVAKPNSMKKNPPTSVTSGSGLQMSYSSCSTLS